MISTCLADTSELPVKDYDYYKQKSAGQKTGAWFLVAGGGICILIAAGMGSEDIGTSWNQLFSQTDEDRKALKRREKTENTLIIAGVVTALGSVPLFIAGRRNKLRARLAMKNEKLSSFLPVGSGKYVSGITLTIPIGK